jgi:hypothetical protein
MVAIVITLTSQKLMFTSEAVHPTMQHTQMFTPQNWDVLKQKNEWHVVFKIYQEPQKNCKENKREKESMSR